MHKSATSIDLPYAITTGDENVNTTFWGHDLIGLNLNMLLMYMLEHIKNVASEEIMDHEARAHDQIVRCKQQVHNIEEKLQHQKEEN